MKHSPRNIEQDFVVLSPQKDASIESCDAGLYQRLAENYGTFKGHELISCHHFDAAWDTWEIHPAGDEIVVLISGRITFVLKIGDEEHQTDLNAVGSFVIVPKNIWHTARNANKAKVLFITPGEGTQNKLFDSSIKD